ncbi:MAG TPA: hypothetical protein ENH03_02220 [Candidatus Bathyarchaeota archaeon]|nr:hypothetical protein [Candidatus Bathyarchaeota archaeon]
MATSIKELNSIPWFAVIGGLVILSMLLYTVEAPDFMQILLPTYVSEALLFIALGYVAMKKKTGAGFAVFLMACAWLLNQMLHWAGLWPKAPDFLTASLWSLFIAQLILAYVVFTDARINFGSVASSSAWVYVATWIVFLFAAGKLWICLGLNNFMWHMWGVGIAVLSLGYIVEPADKTISAFLKIAGTILATYMALAIGGSGLTLIP